MARQALGKGLEALIPMEGDADQPGRGAAKQEVPVDLVAPNPFQPRKDFAPQELEELAASIREQGVIQPIIVRPRAGGRYELVAGERRLRAAKLAGLAQVPAIVREVEDVTSLEVALIENIQRTDLNALEEAQAYQQLQNQFKLTQEDLARKVGRDRSSVANTLRLLKLPSEVQAMISEGKLAEGHARALLMVEDKKNLVNMAKKIVREAMSVREAERLTSGQRTKTAGKRKERITEIQDTHARQLESDLRRKLGTHVKVLPKSAQKGKIEIEYYSLEDLDRILGMIG